MENRVQVNLVPFGTIQVSTVLSQLESGPIIEERDETVVLMNEGTAQTRILSMPRPTLSL